jgi:DNA sulfur modification protein DndC
MKTNQAAHLIEKAVSFTPSLNLIVSDKYAKIRAKSELVIEHILSIIVSGKGISNSFSGGKDSTIVLILAIEALKRAINMGVYVRGFHVTTSNTGLETATEFYVQSMLDSIRSYSDKHGLGIQVHEVFPDLTSSFMYGTVGRGRLPVFPGDSRKCTVDWKVSPQQKILKKVLKESGGIENHVSLIGTRLSESITRKILMQNRQETSTSINADANGFLVSAPIADWEMTEVWSLMMSVDANRGKPTYETFVPNFEWTLEIYKDSNEGTCAIIVGDNGNKKPCGGRHGCSMCQAVKVDRSLESMIENDDAKYGHLKNVNILRNYMRDTRYDLSLRTVFGQTVSEAGYINCRPDNYNWKMRQRLLSYFITLDQDERERAEEHDEKWIAGEVEHTTTNDRLRDPQFEFVSFEMLMAIEFIWSVQCVGENAFPAISIWHDVVTHGRKKYAPILSEDEIKHDKIPAKRFLFVGDDSTLDGNSGLRNIYLEATNERRGLNAYHSYTDNKSGEEFRVAPFESAKTLTIDKEKACAFITLEFPEIYNSVMNDTSRNSLSFLLNRKIIKIGNGKIRMYDQMAKRYQHLQGLLLTFNSFDQEGELAKETISNAEHNAFIDGPGIEECEIDLSAAEIATSSASINHLAPQRVMERVPSKVNELQKVFSSNGASKTIKGLACEVFLQEQAAFAF